MEPCDVFSLVQAKLNGNAAAWFADLTRELVMMEPSTRVQTFIDAFRQRYMGVEMIGPLQHQLLTLTQSGTTPASYITSWLAVFNSLKECSPHTSETEYLPQLVRNMDEQYKLYLGNSAHTYSSAFKLQEAMERRDRQFGPPTHVPRMHSLDADAYSDDDDVGMTSTKRSRSGMAERDAPPTPVTPSLDGSLISTSSSS
jgi:hypothetical protein